MLSLFAQILQVAPRNAVWPAALWEDDFCETDFWEDEWLEVRLDGTRKQADVLEEGAHSS